MQDMSITYADNINSSASLLVKRENPGGQVSPLTGLKKRTRLNAEAGTMPFAAGQPGLRYGSKEEPFDPDKLDCAEFNRETDANHLDPQQSRLQSRLPHGFVRLSFLQTSWNNINQHVEKDVKKEEWFQKRKLLQSPRVSGGAFPQSPLSSKAGEFSSGSIGPHFEAVATTNALGAFLKDKAAVNSIPAVGGT
ncbi:hypothetical protein F3Y22_tig00110187pilonHSYRG00539 [Hibiscus syriacus]|uniref:Uncharacterized protein n=1 Tax=Hibiscus syriacus TaxID=106335 RepID=A0A6A3BGT0_HIBSY|nr:hypothetical protein F3Y22_tig00110187pilonHSYRG00539 [Hibiscus syriacus]